MAREVAHAAGPERRQGGSRLGLLVCEETRFPGKDEGGARGVSAKGMSLQDWAIDGVADLIAAAARGAER